MASPRPDSGSFRRESGVASPIRQVRSRTHSISSDRPSTISHSLLSPPTSVSPAAAFIAASAASQIVTNDHDSHADTWYDQHGIEPAGETALVSPGALGLVNSFLDQLLFSFLQVSKSTSLAALRPAVSEVLKPKLAKDAINNADEELREYLGGADEEDYVQPHGSYHNRDWDLELVWKRTRLRCMVYSSLGDMEEEDEDLHMEQENLEIGADEQIADVISPAVAIFLTSVLEYMGELTLTVAGQAAYHRMRTKLEKDLRDGIRAQTDVADRIVVEELDMERVALDRTLGRLWRGWKKRIRTPTIDSLGRQLSMRSLNRHYRTDSQDSIALKSAALDSRDDLRKSQDHMGQTIAEDVQPSDIALPMRDRDVDEIEVPGLIAYSDDEEETEQAAPEEKRPKSLYLPPSVADALPHALRADHPMPRKRSGSHPEGRFNPFFSRSEQEQLAEEIAMVEQGVQNASKNAQSEEPRSDRDRLAVALDENGVSPLEEDGPMGASNGNNGIGLAMTSDVVSPNEPITSPGDFDSADEDVEYEKAEVMTSARVSMAGSSSPSQSESDKLERTSSVRSARIVSVSAPKTASGSRPASLEASRSASPSESLQKISPAVSQSRAPPAEIRVSSAASSRPAVERLRPVAQSTTAVSESDEEADFFPPELQGVPARSSQSARHPYAQSVRQYQSTRVEPTNNTKVTIIGSSNNNGTFESIPEIPSKAPGHSGRQRPRQDSYDKAAPRASEETITSSPQANGNPTRPTHTSDSSVSSSTGRLKAVRTSEESYAHRNENVARNFEDLIQSNQTITYTLTPENMRDRNASDSPVPKYGWRGDDMRNHGRSGSSSTEPRSPTKTHRSQGSSPQAGFDPNPERVGGQRSSSRQEPRSPRMGGPQAQAREARVPSESTADFAEFIKSTGPPGESRPVPVRSTGPASPVIKNSTESRRVSSNSNRGRYQARDATVADKGDSSDLIDFLRQGPPNSNANSHRIPRHVAPFRNTMDSDQMAGANGGRAVDATIPEIRHSQASTNVTENSMPSMQSSVNSSSALLKKNPPKNGGGMSSKMFDEDDMMPKRKQRRVRDPYAIDFSDEEDEDEELFSAMPKPPVKKEESLAEFLASYQPPEPPPEPPASRQKQPRKKMSAPSLMARFRNTYSRDSHSHSPPPPPKPPVAPQPPASAGRATGGKGHVPIQVTMPPGYDQYGAISNAGPPRRRSTAGNTGKVPMKKFQPREAVSVTTGTSDLADFLKHSEPPPMNNGLASNSAAVEEESNGLSKMFGRRKKMGMA
ncbi:flo11 [Sarocladium implicatum]|nr:flo11 [Sarocladium implicatum]